MGGVFHSWTHSEKPLRENRLTLASLLSVGSRCALLFYSLEGSWERAFSGQVTPHDRCRGAVYLDGVWNLFERTG